MPKHKDFQKIYDSFIRRYGKEKGDSYYFSWLNKYKLDDTKPMPEKITASAKAEIMSMKAYTEPVRFRDKLAKELFKKMFNELTDEQKDMVHKESIKRRGQVPKPSASLNDVTWSRAYINNLPDSAFAWIETGGKKDKEGKTTPRAKRHLTYKDLEGNVDIPHLRNAIARLEKGKPVSMSAEMKSKTRKELQNILRKETGK